MVIRTTLVVVATVRPAAGGQCLAPRHGGDSPWGGIAMRRFAVIPTRFRSARRWFASCAAVLLIILTAGTATAATARSPASADDPAVISEWNAIAVATLAGDTTKQPVEDILYMGFVQAAVYNAVVGVEGRYAPVPVPRPRAARGLGPGGRGGRRAPGAGDLRAVRAGDPGRRLRRVAGADPRRQSEDPGHRVRHPRRRQRDPAARPRRPQRAHLLHPATGAGCLAAHPATVACPCRRRGSAS